MRLIYSKANEALFMSTEYIFKIRTLNDRRAWESIPPHDRRPLPTLSQAIEQARHTADHSAVVEVRVNAAGSHQGHYCPGPHETVQAHRIGGDGR